MTRAEHIRWCKKRAREAYDYGKETSREGARRIAVKSMVADLGKNAETEVLQRTALALSETVVDEASLFNFIDGFAE